MKLCFHPRVQKDLDEVLNYYSERSLTAADRFWDELHDSFKAIGEQPRHFPYINEQRGLRRARLHHFPYLIIFYATGESVKITCVKHEKRHPIFGITRR